MWSNIILTLCIKSKSDYVVKCLGISGLSLASKSFKLQVSNLSKLEFHVLDRKIHPLLYQNPSGVAEVDGETVCYYKQVITYGLYMSASMKSACAVNGG